VGFDGLDKLMVGSLKGLSRCSLKGNTCEAISNGPATVTDFLYSKKSPKTLYVAGDNKLWISRDDGSSWIQSQEVPKGNIFHISLDESGDRPIIRVIWTQGWNGGVLLTRDEGQTWEGQDKNLINDKVSDPTTVWARKGGRSNSVQVDPFDPNVIFRTDWWTVWRSDDGGASWNEKVVGAPNTVATQVLLASNGDVYVATMDNGLLRSHDGGKTYECLFPKKWGVSKAGHVWRVAVFGKSIVATASPWNQPKVNEVIVSSDGGKTFDIIHDGLPEKRPHKNTMWGQGYPRALAVDPHNRDTIYLGIDGDDGGGLFVSRDKGLTWQLSEGQPGSLRVFQGLAVDPTDSKRIVWGAVGSHGGVYVSNDKGQTFERVLTDMSSVFNVVIGGPDGTIYAGGSQDGPTLYVSNPDKKSFHLLKHFDDKISKAIDGIAVNPNDPRMIAVSAVHWAAGSPCKFYLSRDAGQSWEEINGDLPDGTGASSMAFDPKGQYLYIARYAGSVYRMALQ